MFNEGNGSYVYLDGSLTVLFPKVEVMVSSEDDLSGLTEHVAPGSIAYTSGGADKWQLGLDYTWTYCGSNPPETTEEEPAAEGGE